MCALIRALAKGQYIQLRMSVVACSDSEDKLMPDAIMLILGAGSFALLIGYVFLCDKL